jgi:predicted RNase H-like HicB family nuclease
MASPLTISWTIAYEDGGDGWVIAHVVEKPEAMSQGRTRVEARENVRDALRELLIYEAANLTAEATKDLERLDVEIMR